MREIESHPEYGYLIEGYVDEPGFPVHVRLPRLGVPGDLAQILSRTRVDEVFIALPMRSQYDQILRSIEICEEQGIAVHLPGDLFTLAVAHSQSSMLASTPLMFAETASMYVENLLGAFLMAALLSVLAARDATFTKAQAIALFTLFAAGAMQTKVIGVLWLAPLGLYGAWIALRREHPALRSGKLIELFSDDETYVFARQLGTETILIAFNRENKTKQISVPVGSIGVKDGVTWKTLIEPAMRAGVVNGEAKLILPPQVAIAFGVQ